MISLIYVFFETTGMIGWDDAHIFGMARWVFITPIFRFWSGKPETRPCADGCSWSIRLAHLNALNMFNLECECIYAFCGIWIKSIMTRLSFLGGHLEDSHWIVSKSWIKITGRLFCCGKRLRLRDSEENIRKQRKRQNIRTLTMQKQNACYIV